MKQLQIIVSIPPEEVVRRLSSAIGKPGLGLAVPFGGKDFFGTINGLSFQFRNRRRGSRNSFARGSSHRWDRLVDLGSGATINTIVYTFRVKFDQKNFHHIFNRSETGIERIFSCYVDEDAHGWY
jgi:hypothetical protein